MPAPLDVDREQVRLLVQREGVRAAARMCGLSEATVSAWSARYGWIKELMDQPKLPPTMIQSVPRSDSKTVPTEGASGASRKIFVPPADAQAEAIRRGVYGYKTAAAKVGEKLGTMDPDELMLPGTADSAQKWAGIAVKSGLLSGGGEPTIRLELLARGSAIGAVVELDEPAIELSEAPGNPDS